MPTPPIKKVAGASPTRSATPPTAMGAPVWPASPMRRQTPKNSPMESLGARSAPNVIMVPEPRPLPKPMSMVAARKV